MTSQCDPDETSVALLFFALLVPAVAQHAPPAKPFERFEGCVLEPDEWTDGDSFRVRLPDGRLETFRLYFVDTTESRSRGKRSDDQAAYFGLTREGAIELGKVAKAFTAAALAKPFVIQTRWRAVFGPARYYAFVFTAAGDDLAELLVRDGLARIYGTRTPTPDGRDSRVYLAGANGARGRCESRRSWWVAPLNGVGAAGKRLGRFGSVSRTGRSYCPRR